jgi:hypothetical protein
VSHNKIYTIDLQNLFNFWDGLKNIQRINKK